MSNTSPLPGWHPDPENPEFRQRWWDGRQWLNVSRPLYRDMSHVDPVLDKLDEIALLLRSLIVAVQAGQR